MKWKILENIYYKGLLRVVLYCVLQSSIHILYVHKVKANIDQMFPLIFFLIFFFYIKNIYF